MVKSVLSQLTGKEVFRAFRNSLVDKEERGVWIDVNALVSTNLFEDWINQTIVRKIPTVTDAVIYLDDEGPAKTVADRLEMDISAHGGVLDSRKFKSLSGAVCEMKKLGGAVIKDPSPIVVIAGAAGRGSELLAASRTLREYAPKSFRIFCAAATMPFSQQDYELLRGNLCYPKHEFEVLIELCLDRLKLKESWLCERELLQEYEDNLPGPLKNRLRQLRQTSEGLLNNLFLTRKRGEKLQLRRNFAFWPDAENMTGVSQADVFVTIAAVLENMRTGRNIAEQERLRNDAYTHTMLSAETFSRYNDGIIQAAILRTANPIELNYEDAAKDSYLIYDLIRQMVMLHKQPQGEALCEFLMALCTGRMKLCKGDKKNLVGVLTSGGNERTVSEKWLMRTCRDLLCS